MNTNTNTNHTYNGTGTCDWCNESGPLRELGPTDGDGYMVPVLAICQECDDKHVEEDNQKEKDMNNCVGIFSNGKAHNATAKETIEVRHLNGVVYLPTKFPYGGDTKWATITIPVCGHCLKQLNAKTGKPYPGAMRIKYIDNTILKEDDMNTDEPIKDAKPEPYFEYVEFDQEYSYQNAIKALGGHPFDPVNLHLGGTALVERCHHEDCDADRYERIPEMHREMCCGEDDCAHYFPVLCLHHDENVKEKVITREFGDGGRGQWFPTATKAKEFMLDLGRGKLQRAKKRGFWVYWNVNSVSNVADNHDNRANLTSAIKDNQIITVKCGYGKNSHDWTAPRGEIKAAGGKCPEHRS